MTITHKWRFIILFIVSAGLICTGHSYRKVIHTPGIAAYAPGEVLKFNIDFNGISSGEAILQVMPDKISLAGREHYHIHVHGRSYKFFDNFYKVRDYYESFIDVNTFLPSVFIRDIQEGPYTKKEHYLFNQNTNKVLSDSKIYDVPPGIHDVISAFYYLRCMDFSTVQEGTVVPVKSFFENEIFPLGVKFIGRKTIKTDIGTIKCLLFQPLLIEGRVFKDQSGMELYVSDDKNQLPVLIQSDVYLGKVSAELKSYAGLKYPLAALVKK
ncbi:MAG: DUF3108 domain-containing protein [Bacteroidota bacterium]|nr:DUF3108 domain-containing protein [Bacteroidota bacterium]